jgi:hypothetical protein
METPIGRCSLCAGTVVRDESLYAYPSRPRARCTSCGATEAPPDKVIPMEKRQPVNLDALRKDLQGQLREAFRQNTLPPVDAIGKQFLPPQKPCPHCGPIPMGGYTGIAGA